MKSEKIRIVLADDHKMMRDTWKMLLQQEERFDIVSECSNGAEAIEAATKHAPDIILMDINMSPVNGFEATRKIVKQIPGIRIIGVSINNQPAYARNMLESGAKGYVTKNSSKEEMIEAIIAVFNGEQYVCREIKAKMNK